MEQLALVFPVEPPPQLPDPITVILRWDQDRGGVRSAWPDLPRLQGMWFPDWAHALSGVLDFTNGHVRVRVRG